MRHCLLSFLMDASQRVLIRSTSNYDYDSVMLRWTNASHPNVCLVQSLFFAKLNCVVVNNEIAIELGEYIPGVRDSPDFS